MKKILFFFMILAWADSYGQNLEGTWYGKTTVGHIDLRIIFDIAFKDGQYSASMQSPDQNEEWFEASGVSFEQNQLKINIRQLNFEYNGTLCDDEVIGWFTQSGIKFTLNLSKEENKSKIIRISPENITGKWFGMTVYGGQILRMNLDINYHNEQYSGFYNNPHKNDKWNSITSVIFSNGNIIIKIDELNFSYTGSYIDGNIEGIAHSNSHAIPFVFYREEKKINRPQHPSAPFPYLCEDVKFPNKIENFDLAGTLTIPEGDGPFTGVILVTGSGRQDRDETMFEHKPFLVIADYLTRHGIAVLRYDDRGFASSGGTYDGSTITDFTTDAIAAVEFLRQHPKIKSIGIAGHSEGGTIALMAAVENIPDFIISLAGMGIKGAEMIALQRRASLKLKGAPDDFIEKVIETRASIDSINFKTSDPEIIKKEVGKIVKNTLLEMAENEGPLGAEIVSLLQFDPDIYLPHIKCPVLALNGEKDFQISYKENLEGIINGINKGGNTNVKTISYPGLNHLFQTAETGTAEEYGVLEETFNEKVLENIVEWIKQIHNE